MQDCTRAELDAWVEANAAALRARLPADLVFVNHVLLGGPVGAAVGARYVVKAHGSELEYSMRGNAELVRVGREALGGAAAVDRRLGAHPRGARRGVRRTSSACTRSRRAWTSSSGDPPPKDEALARAGRGVPAGPAQPGQRERAAPRRGQRRPARGLPRRRQADRRLLREADREQGRPGAPRGAARASTRARRDRRLRRLPRRARAPGRGARRPLHRPARAPPPRAPARARGRRGRPLDLPGGLRDGRGRGGRGRLPADRRRTTPGSPRSPQGLEQHYPPELRHLPSFPSGDAGELRARLQEQLALGPRGAGGACARPRALATVELWSWTSVARRILEAAG